MARNPSMRENVPTYTVIGMDLLELLAIIVTMIAVCTPGKLAV